MNGNLYKTAKTRFLVRSKKSGQLLGYALLLPEVTVDDGDAHLVPWPDDELQPIDPVVGFNESTTENEAVAELDISSSVSSECDPSEMPDKQSLTTLCQTNLAPQSEVAVDTVLLSSQPSSQVSEVVRDAVDQDLEAIDNNKGMQLKRKKEVTYKEDIIGHGGGQGQGPSSKIIKLEKTDHSPEDEGSLNPQENSGMYDIFVQFVDERNNTEMGLPKYRKKVKCILCTGEKVISYGNVGRHIESYHLPSVVCEICNCKISQKRFMDHMKRVHSDNSKQKSKDVKDNAKSSSGLKRTRAPTEIKNATTEKTSTTNSSQSKSGTFNTSNPSFDLKSEYSINNNTGPPVILANIDPKSQTFNDVDEEKNISEPTTEKEIVPPASKENRKSTIANEQVSITITSDSVEGLSIKMGLDKADRMKKVMRKFGKRFNVNYKQLKFMLNNAESQASMELLGEEIVGDLKTRNVTVVGNLTS